MAGPKTIQSLYDLYRSFSEIALKLLELSILKQINARSNALKVPTIIVKRNDSNFVCPINLPLNWRNHWISENLNLSKAKIDLI
ncbi:hypothetical protein L1887_10738 [Cichorium endivia]|nr:hypothetical protein L1887_10738 [Cichorium endivia]